MPTYVRPIVLVVCALVVAGRGLAPGAHAQTRPVPEEFTALAVNGSSAGGATTIVDIRVTRWSTDAEQARFARELATSGPDAFLAALSDARPVGSIQSPGSLPWPLRFARQEALGDGGRRILILTDRPIGAWEMALDAASLDYPLSLIQLQLNAEGEGEGVISVATRISVDAKLDRFGLDNYDGTPIRLVDVRSRRST